MSLELRSRTTARIVTIARYTPSTAYILTLKYIIRLRYTELKSVIQLIKLYVRNAIASYNRYRLINIVLNLTALALLILVD